MLLDVTFVVSTLRTLSWVFFLVFSEGLPTPAVSRVKQTMVRSDFVHRHYHTYFAKTKVERSLTRYCPSTMHYKCMARNEEVSVVARCLGVENKTFRCSDISLLPVVPVVGMCSWQGIWMGFQYFGS